MRLEKYIYHLLLIMTALMTGCSHESTPTFDQVYKLRGNVVNSVTREEVDKVIIGIKASSVPDSIVFAGDSLNSNVSNAFLMQTVSDTTGYYQWDWFLGYRRTEMYKDIFAYKKGYRLWVYSRDSSAAVNQVNEFIDELNISLIPK